MKIYVTKDFLMRGIQEVDNAYIDPTKGFEETASVGTGERRINFSKGDWHTTKQATLHAVNEIISKEISIHREFITNLILRREKVHQWAKS